MEYTEERHLIRDRDSHRWRKFKRIIAPLSEIHHEWIGKTASYRCIALIEKEIHRRLPVKTYFMVNAELQALKKSPQKGWW